MILDTSAVIAVIRDERDRMPLVEAIEAADRLGIGAPTLVESSIVLVRRLGLVGRLALTHFLERNEVVAIPFDERHWALAAEAFLRYGKGRHPAGLNFGDCMSYATAGLAEASLLFVGEDFAKTDVRRALA